MKMYSATIRDDALKVRSSESYYARQKKVFVLVVVTVSVLPLLVIGWASFHYYKQSWLQQTSLDLASSVEARKEIIDRFLATQEDLLTTLVELYGRQHLAKQENLERVFPAANRGGVLVDLGAIDAQGNHLAYVGPYRDRLLGKNYRDSEWFGETMRNGRYVSDIFSGYRGEPHFVVAVADANRTWIIRATINSALFNDLLARAEVGPGGDAFILNRKGEKQTLSRSPGMSGPSPERFPEMKAVHGTTVRRHDNGIYAMAWVNDNSWLLVLKTDIRSSLAGFYRAWNLGVLSIVAASVCILAVASILARSLMGRIESADRQRMVLNNRVREVEKMALIGRLAASVAHEVNNPLQIIGDQAGWIAELLEDEDANQVRNYGEYTQAVEKIRQHVGRASAITHRLLGFSRPMDAKRQATDLNALVKDTVSFLDNEARNNRITVRLVLQDGLPPVITDPAQMQQVFLNIVNNAIDAIGHDGVLTIRTSLSTGRVLTEFADSGPGLPPEYLQKIFDPFFTTKQSGKGTGLGLSISRNILQRLGGDIMVENGKQGGCRFTVSLPAGQTGTG